MAYEQWDRVWTAAGAVPEGINKRLGMRELSTEMYSKVKEAARRGLKCAERIWEERNQENEDWIDSKEDLKERKKESNITERRFVSRVNEKMERPRKRIQQNIYEREKHLQQQYTTTTELVHEWVENENAGKAKARKLHLSQEEIEMIMVIEKEAARKSIMEIRKRRIERARVAGDTPDLDLTNVNTVEVRDTVPVYSSKKMKPGTGKAFVWVPVKGSQVRVLWTDSCTKIEGSKRRGEWYNGRVTELCWPEGSCMPGAYIRYDADGVEEWHSIEMFGDTIELITVPKDKYKTINGDKKAVTVTQPLC